MEKRINVILLTLAAALMVAAGPAHASNLLVNPSFEGNSGHAVATGWTYFLPPASSFSIPPGGTNHYWIENNVPAHSGTLFWKEWGAAYDAAPTNNVAGIYQDLSSTPGSTYQASAKTARLSIQPDRSRRGGLTIIGSKIDNAITPAMT